jgi:predicted nucleotidyltransferase
MAKREFIKADFSFLFDKKEVLAVLLYGSTVKDDETPRSDIDICIVAPSPENRAELLKDVYRNLDVFSKKYDVRIFEELPLYMQIQIIQSHEVVHTKDIYEMHEYFYYFRKLWEDQASRQHMTREELAAMLG